MSLDGGEIHRCDDCGETFTARVALGIHINMRHTMPEPGFYSQAFYEQLSHTERHKRPPTILQLEVDVMVVKDGVVAVDSLKLGERGAERRSVQREHTAQSSQRYQETLDANSHFNQPLRRTRQKKVQSPAQTNHTPSRLDIIDKANARRAPSQPGSGVQLNASAPPFDPAYNTVKTHRRLPTPDKALPRKVLQPKKWNLPSQDARSSMNPPSEEKHVWLVTESETSHVDPSTSSNSGNRFVAYNGVLHTIGYSNPHDVSINHVSGSVKEYTASRYPQGAKLAGHQLAQKTRFQDVRLEEGIKFDDPSQQKTRHLAEFHQNHQNNYHPRFDRRNGPNIYNPQSQNPSFQGFDPSNNSHYHHTQQVGRHNYHHRPGAPFEDGRDRSESVFKNPVNLEELYNRKVQKRPQSTGLRVDEASCKEHHSTPSSYSQPPPEQTSSSGPPPVSSPHELPSVNEIFTGLWKNFIPEAVQKRATESFARRRSSKDVPKSSNPPLQPSTALEHKSSRKASFSRTAHNATFDDYEYPRDVNECDFVDLFSIKDINRVQEQIMAKLHGPKQNYGYGEALPATPSHKKSAPAPAHITPDGLPSTPSHKKSAPSSARITPDGLDVFMGVRIRLLDLH